MVDSEEWQSLSNNTQCLGKLSTSCEKSTLLMHMPNIVCEIYTCCRVAVPTCVAQWLARCCDCHGLPPLPCSCQHRALPPSQTHLDTVTQSHSNPPPPPPPHTHTHITHTHTLTHSHTHSHTHTHTHTQKLAHHLNRHRRVLQCRWSWPVACYSRAALETAVYGT